MYLLAEASLYTLGKRHQRCLAYRVGFQVLFMKMVETLDGAVHEWVTDLATAKFATLMTTLSAAYEGMKHDCQKVKAAIGNKQFVRELRHCVMAEQKH